MHGDQVVEETLQLLVAALWRHDGAERPSALGEQPAEQLDMEAQARGVSSSPVVPAS